MTSTQDYKYKLLRNAIILVHDENDHVKPHYNTDLLIEGDTIAAIGNDLALPPPSQANIRIIDCTDKIVCPGLVDTHHHLWQTQLKGRHADESLLEYFPSGMMKSYCYRPDDIFWGQLSGSLEAIDAGTTFVLDHSHGCYTRESAEQALKASVASGLRMVYALAPAMRLQKWDKEQFVPVQEAPVPDWQYDFVEDYCKQQPIAGRVGIGFGYDAWYMPEEYTKAVFERVRKAGIKVMTNHTVKNVVFDLDPAAQMQQYGLLDKDIVLSHGTSTDMTEAQKKFLYDAGVSISSTPETECQMGMGWPIALDENVHGSLGIDCHTSNSSSILIQARMLQQQIRQKDGQKMLEEKTCRKKPLHSSEQLFNLATIQGARAVGLGDEVGSIKTGKKADLVIFEPTNSPSMLCSVEYDPMTAILRHSDIRDIDTVIIGGIVRKEGGKLLPVQVDSKEVAYSDVARSTLASRKKLQERINQTSWDKAYEAMIGMFYLDQSKIV